MSKRTSQSKKIRKLRHLLRYPLPAYIDLVQYLKLRRYARTTGEAKKIILAGRVKSESHVLGIVNLPTLVDGTIKDMDHVSPLIPAHLRPTIHVVDA